MRIELPNQLEAYVQYKIESGLYSNGAEVIRDALRHMMHQDEDTDQILRLRDAVQRGFQQIERGEGVPYTPALMEEMEQTARAQAQQGQHPKTETAA